MAETYYDVLGIAADASHAEITAAYRERVLETHPDRNDDPDAVDQFKLVTTAEEVLTDETKRARYDRLGHDGYVGMVERFSSPSSASDQEAQTDRRGSTTRTERTDTESTTGAETSTEDSRSTTGGARRRASSGRRRRSHHARQRARRASAAWADTGARGSAGSGTKTRAEAHFRHGTNTDSGTETRSRYSRRGPDAGTGTGTGTDTDTDADAEVDTDTTTTGGRDSSEDRSNERTATDDGFRYTVHGWDDDIQVGREGRPLDHSTIVIVCCITLVYPLLVYSSLTPQFWLPVNVIVAACTLVLVGYLLTMPRVAITSFGLWSVLVPFALPRVIGLEPVSLLGALVVGAFWVPLGFAVALRWAMRP